MQMKMSYVIRNKKYTNKRKWKSHKAWYLQECLTRLKFLDSIDFLLQTFFRFANNKISIGISLKISKNFDVTQH